MSIANAAAATGRRYEAANVEERELWFIEIVPVCIHALTEYTHDLTVSASRSAEPPLWIRSSALGHRVNHWRECLQWPRASAPSGRWQPHKGAQWHDFASRRAIDRPSSRSRAVAVAQAGRVCRFPAAIWPSTDDRRGLLFADRQSGK